MATEKKPAKAAKPASPKGEKTVKEAAKKDAAPKTEKKAVAPAAKTGPVLEGNAKTPRLQLVYDREIVPALPRERSPLHRLPPRKPPTAAAL